MAKLRKMKIFFIIAFMSFLTVPLVNINFESGKISENENRYLVSFPEIIDDNTGRIRKEFFSEFNDWLNDNIGFREFFVKLNANINYKIFGISSNPMISVGKDGWMFYTGDNNLQIANGKYPLTDEILEKIKEEQVSIQKALQKKGIEYVLILTPSKVSIYPEKIIGYRSNNLKTPIDIVQEYLEKNTTIKVINTKDILIDAKNKGKQVFHKTDTHWNEQGAYIAYKYIVNKLNEWGIINTNPINIVQKPSKYKGEFSAMMGAISLLEEEEILATEIENSLSNRVTSGMLFDMIYNTKNTSNFTDVYLYENVTNKDGTALVYGDSFFASWKFTELLSQNFSKLAFVYYGKINNEMLEVVNPKIVIMERTERYIDTLVNQSESNFTNLPIKNPNSKIVSDTTPKIINKNRSYNIDITVKNTSDEIWSEERLIRLCIWQDGLDFGYRIKIPDGVEIKPGEEYTFTLENFRANDKNSTYLEYQMVQEGIAYFGDKKRVDIVIK